MYFAIYFSSLVPEKKDLFKNVLMLREDALENISMGRKDGVFAQSWLSSVLLKLMMCQPFYFF